MRLPCHFGPLPSTLELLSDVLRFAELRSLRMCLVDGGLRAPEGFGVYPFWGVVAFLPLGKGEPGMDSDQTTRKSAVRELDQFCHRDGQQSSPHHWEGRLKVGKKKPWGG